MRLLRMHRGRPAGVDPPGHCRGVQDADTIRSVRLLPRTATVPMPDLSHLLQHAPDDASLADALAIGAAYDEIRRLARSFMRNERADHTLAPTALANEAYLRLFGAEPQAFRDDGAFLAAAVTTLRRILVEHSRRRARQKRGGSARRADVDTEQLPAPAADERLIALDAALERLAAFDASKAKLVELRFFGGLSVDEAARVLAVSPRTAARDWRVARAFLRSELDGQEGTDDLDA
jgi:RNA polymerase sigma-70 factor (ECF subfamily)